MGHFDIRTRIAPEIRRASDRRLLGMPGPVWTMAVWFACSFVILVVSLCFPMSAQANLPVRIVLACYAAIVVVLLLIMRERTPPWFLHVQTLLAIACALWIVYLSVTPTGAVTSAISLIVVAAYMAWWMALRAALTYMLLASAGLIVAFAASDRLPQLVVPWLLVSEVSLGLMWAFATLVAQMNNQLITDPLTGLLNRSGMVTLLDHRGELLRAVEPRTLMVIDLDRFKDINDREGHLAGDRTLVDFGTALRGAIRPDDIAFRSGGDEFVIILARTDTDGGHGFAQRLHSSFDLEWSYGLTQWEPDESFDTALGRADRLMYEQKASRATRRGPDDRPDALGQAS